MHSERSFSRRQLLGTLFLGTAGFWAASSSDAAARMFRAVVRNSTQRIVRPKHMPQPDKWPDNRITAAWLGHSTVLVNFYGIWIVTDPVLLPRVGLNLPIGTVGPKRLVAAALAPDQLPPVDLVLLSHAHLDHLDVPTLKCLPQSSRIVTAPATADILVSGRVPRQVTELKWGEHLRLNGAKGELLVQSFEVKHWGARWRRDQHRGYAGYTLEREGRKILFGGDTAFTDNFRSLRPRGPFDLAIMPIGAYEPWVCSHCTPEQAVRMADDAGAHLLLPVHHQTFPLGRERRSEPIERLQEALPRQRIGWREIGETCDSAIAGVGGAYLTAS